jgi:CBS domain-containing protein
MTDSTTRDGQPAESIVELFHMVKSLIPDGQKVVTVAPDTSVAAAIKMMQTDGFSQVPVVSGSAVLGVFSYRSLSHTLLDLGPIDTDFRELPVDVFMEQFAFVHAIDKWATILEMLDREDGVLVGNRDNLQGILTSMDVLVYLLRLASPFVMLAEIETSLRRIIEACVDQEALKQCVINSLSAKYTLEDMPTSLSSMTFNDYVQILGHGRNWPRFELAFGKGPWLRKQTVARLSQVRDLRNDTFHFKRQLDDDDHAILKQHRDWLEMKTRSFEGRQREVEAPPEVGDTKKPRKKQSRGKTNRSAFLAACDPVAADFLAWMLDEAALHGFTTSWGTEGFSVRTKLPGRMASFAYGRRLGIFQFFFSHDLGLSSDEAAAWRQELLAFGVLEEHGVYSLKSRIVPGTEAKLREVFALVLRKVSTLTRYPLPIQATVQGDTVTASLLDEQGRVRFDGAEYSSVSAAGKAAAGWQSVNGWTFWRYYDEVSREWRPIDDLRK